MKFIYADSMDFIDPEFDFDLDRNGQGRVSHRDDEYPHEFLGYAPYDGILVSRGIVGDIDRQGKYSLPQMMRFRREGARRFLRYETSNFPHSLVFGDCGAFTYRDAKTPPYTPRDTLDFYEDGGFTHGCSVDHIIFDFDSGLGRSRAEVPRETLDRYDITLELAAEFIALSKRMKGFTPLGVIQGWSAPSMGWAASQLVHMGYDYLAVGGLVPLDIQQIHSALGAIRDSIPARVRLHLLGFGKIDDLSQFEGYGVASFDTTSPLLRAFKDAHKNYFMPRPDGEMEYYTAIRIPQTRENNKLKSKARRGVLHQEDMLVLERAARDAVRAYAARTMDLEPALEAILGYWKALNWKEAQSDVVRARAAAKQRDVYARTLGDRPWERCDCRVCTESGVEVVVFRNSNRNKRRGIHNLHVFYQHIRAQKAAHANA